VKDSIVEIIEQVDRWQKRYRSWRSPQRSDSDLGKYPFVENKLAPFTPARRALPMLNLALISSAGAYIDGAEPFDTSKPDGDITFREIPTQIDPRDLQFAGRGYDQTFIREDINAQVPLARFDRVCGKRSHRPT